MFRRRSRSEPVEPDADDAQTEDQAEVEDETAGKSASSGPTGTAR